MTIRELRDIMWNDTLPPTIYLSNNKISLKLRNTHYGSDIANMEVHSIRPHEGYITVVTDLPTNVLEAIDAMDIMGG